MSYTPIPVILDRVLSASITYETAKCEQVGVTAGFSSVHYQEAIKRPLFMVIARQRLRNQYKLVK